MVDTAMLRERIEQSGLKLKYLAEALGITPQGLHKKLSNNSEFKASEIAALAELLGLSMRERDLIFFPHWRDGKSHIGNITDSPRPDSVMDPND